MKYGNLKKPNYSSCLGGEVIALGAGNYLPYQIKHSEKLTGTRTGKPVETLGVHQVGDCVGIVGWHPQTKAIYIFHMSEVLHLRFAYSLLKMVQLTTSDPAVRGQCQALWDQTEEILDNSGDIRARHFAVANVIPFIAELEENPLKEIKFDLITHNERNLESGYEEVDVIAMLHKFGITDEQISLDRKSSQIFINRENGTISNQHIEYPLEKEGQIAEFDIADNADVAAPNTPQDTAWQTRVNNAENETTKQKENNKSATCCIS